EARGYVEKATQRGRKLLEDDLTAQLEGVFDIVLSGTVAPRGGPHLSPLQQAERLEILAAIAHRQALGMPSAEAVNSYVRDAAFTALNRFVALKMLEARELSQESISQGEDSAGYREF